MPSVVDCGLDDENIPVRKQQRLQSRDAEEAKIFLRRGRKRIESKPSRGILEV